MSYRLESVIVEEIMFDVTIIGAGVVGAAIARELSKYKLDIAIIEKEPDVALGTSKANSAIIHSGYDAEPGTVKAVMNAKGNPMFDKLCSELDVPFKRIGSYVLAFSEAEKITLEALLKRGGENHIPGLELHSREQILEKEPNVSTSVVAGLHANTAGIIGPWELTIALIENAIENGVTLYLDHEVLDIKKEEHFSIKTSQGMIESKIVINAAGVFADQIHNMVDEPNFEIKAWKGQYYILDKVHEGFVNSVLFQCPSDVGKGVLILPTVHGNILIGPDSQEFEDKEDVSTDTQDLEYIRDKAMKTSKDIPMWDVITTFAGLRAKPSTHDFIIEPSKTTEGFYDVAGIESPGLSSAPAIAEYVVKWIIEQFDFIEENQTFDPRRVGIPHFMDLPLEEKKKLIEEDSRFGHVVCRCEYITEAEIVRAIHSTLGATTVDGVKRRVRPGMGRCQGGFCGAKVMEILARELDKDIKEIVKDKKESVIVTGMTKE